jgi:hypothetical protein
MNDIDILYWDEGRGFVAGFELDQQQNLLKDLVFRVFEQLPAGLGPSKSALRGMMFLPQFDSWVTVLRARNASTGSAGACWIRLRSFLSAVEAWKDLLSAVPPWEADSKSPSPKYLAISEPNESETVPYDVTAARAEDSEEENAVVVNILTNVLGGRRFIQEPRLTDDIIATTLQCLPEKISSSYVWSSCALIKPNSKWSFVIGRWPSGTGAAMDKCLADFTREWPPAKEELERKHVLPKEDIEWVVCNRFEQNWAALEVDNITAFRNQITVRCPWKSGEYLHRLNKGEVTHELWEKMKKDGMVAEVCKDDPGLVLDLCLAGHVPTELELQVMMEIIPAIEFYNKLAEAIHDDSSIRKFAVLLKRTAPDISLWMGRLRKLPREKVYSLLSEAGFSAELRRPFEPLSANLLVWLMSKRGSDEFRELRDRSGGCSPEKWNQTWEQAWQIQLNQGEQGQLAYYLDFWAKNPQDCPAPPRRLGRLEQARQGLARPFKIRGSKSLIVAWSEESLSILGREIRRQRLSVYGILHSLIENGYIRVFMDLLFFMGIALTEEQVASNQYEHPQIINLTALGKRLRDVVRSPLGWYSIIATVIIAILLIL